MMTKEEFRTAAEKIRLVVCDMDGTLLDSKKGLSPATLEAIRAARQKGILTTICSGRVYPMLGFYVHRLALDVPFISSNGAAIVDPIEDRILDHRPVPRDDAERLFVFCKRHGFDYCALGPDGGFFSPGGQCIDRFTNYNRIAREAGLKEMTLRLFDTGHKNGLEHPIHKMLIYRLDKDGRVLTEDFLKSCDSLAYTFSDPLLIDVAASEVDKGYGLRRLARLMGVAMEEICVFGDYVNDLPMFEEAGLSVAMGNACDEVRNRANFVTGSNDNDGVAEAILNYILR